jgi:hypothetical protein
MFLHFDAMRKWLLSGWIPLAKRQKAKFLRPSAADKK